MPELHPVSSAFHFFCIAFLALGGTRKAQQIKELGAGETGSWQPGAGSMDLGTVLALPPTTVTRQIMQVWGCSLQSINETSPTHHRGGAQL